MTFRTLAASFFLLYGGLMPIAASDFMVENHMATLAMIASCVVIAALLFSRRAPLLNLLIALYVFRVYLTRPYVNVFLPELRGTQLVYVDSVNYFYNPQDASVVYLSLLSLLLAWLIGLHVLPSKKNVPRPAPWIFRQVDGLATGACWPFWLAWALLSVLNFKSASEGWQGVTTGDDPSTFAWGMFQMATISIVCLYSFLLGRQPGGRRSSLLLLVPVLFTSVTGVAGGSRSALFTVVVLALSYWLFLNWDKRVGRRGMLWGALVALLFPIVIFSGLLAQMLRPLLRYGADPAIVWKTTLAGLDLSNPNNPLLASIYFGLTQLLHRLSSLYAPFMILNDHFIHDPWETFNPLQTLMRIINELLPGDLFSGVVGTNQLFNYIYQDAIVSYNSETWSIQGTLYLYFGFWFSPLAVFGVASVIGRQYRRLEFLAHTSPAFAAFFILLVNGVIEFGTLERVIPNDVVRPLTAFLAIIVLVRAFRFIIPTRLRSQLSGEPC